MFKIGIDAQGGDNGEIVVLDAIFKSLNEFNDIKFYVFGNESNITKYFADKQDKRVINNIEIINCNDKIEMNDHPVFAIREKTDSSIVKAANFLKNEEIEAFISAGSTGALIAIAQFIVKPITNVDRPVLGAVLPTTKNPLLLADSGCNVDSKPEWLHQYAILSNNYYRLLFDNDKPSIGLLSVGIEENKGNNLTIEVYKLLKDDKRINFIGNVEARDLTYGVCDIVIADGFAGNIFLKTYEGTATMLLSLIKEQIKSTIIGKIGGLLIKPSMKKLLKKYDPSIYGGAPVLGANKLIIKCHGNSKLNEFYTSIKQARKLISNNFINNLKKSFEV